MCVAYASGLNPSYSNKFVGWRRTCSSFLPSQLPFFLAGKHQVRTKLRKNCGVKKQTKPFPRPGQLSGCQFDAKTSKSFKLSGYVVDNLCYDHYILKPGTAPDNVYLRTSLPQHTRAGVLFNFCAQSGHTTNMVLTTINWAPWKLELSQLS